MPEPHEYRLFRDSLVEALERELFGPRRDDPDDIRHEKLDVSPLQIYGAGILFPRKLRQNVLEDMPEGESREDYIHPEHDEIGDELDEMVKADDGGNRRVSAISADAGIDEQPLNLANEYSPAALGLTCRLEGTDRLQARVSFGTYDAIEVSEKHPRAGEQRADGTPFPDTRKYIHYRRTPRLEIVDIPLDFGAEVASEFPIPHTYDRLKLHTLLRAADDDGIVLSLMLVNHNESLHSGMSDTSGYFFQTEFEVRDAEGRPVFTQIDRPSGASSADELASMDLLYRHRRAFCLGHGCAGNWRRGPDVEIQGTTDWVCTATLPTYEVQPIEPRSTPYGSGELRLSMRFLSEGEGIDDDPRRRSILGALEELCRDYQGWIEDRENEATALAGSMASAASRHLAACRVCLDRMRAGVGILGDVEDDIPLTAFRLANRAMLMQQVHTGIEARDMGSEFPELPVDYNEGPEAVRRWRPFQLAFILMNVSGAVHNEHPDRDIVDLIWFPTGGGKTEAYLGLAAYIICLRRLRDPSNAGTTVLMRYTLRLLTAQQFQRASALILALDTLRAGRFLDADLGPEPISIGLWVGQSLSPNRREEARAALREMRQERARGSNPFQVLHCPWCRCEMKNREHLGYVEERTAAGQARTVRFRCPDPSCPWSDAGMHMPVMVIDEDIYESPPTLLLGTVDKFAQIAWDDRTGRLFGIGLENDAPDLIIQDELHLISGPLGTIVGLYETAIERFCIGNRTVLH